MLVREDNLERILFEIRSVLENEFFSFLQVDLTSGWVIDLNTSQKMYSPRVGRGYVYFSTGIYSVMINPGTIVSIEGGCVKLNFKAPNGHDLTNWFKIERHLEDWGRE